MQRAVLLFSLFYFFFCRELALDRGSRATLHKHDDMIRLNNRIPAHFIRLALKGQ